MSNVSSAENSESSQPKKWQDGAHCLGMDPDLFDETKENYDEAAAKNACGACAVRQACLDFALENPGSSEKMIFGGLTESERDALQS